MSDLDLAYASATKLAGMIREGRISSAEAVGNALARIGEVNGVLNCFCFVYGEEALDLARAADQRLARGAADGPLHGVPIAIKDFTPMKGKRTTQGSLILEHWVPDDDPIIVARLRAAGAIVIGKTTTPEFAHSSFTESALWGLTRNPWDLGRAAWPWPRAATWAARSAFRPPIAGWWGQFRQSVFGRLGGYEDVNDADRLGRDPAMRWIVGGKAVERQAASTSQMGRFETELLATDANIEVLAGMNGAWIDKVHDRRPPKMIILDMDSSVSPTHGEQEGTAYNGHFGCTCYHPLFLFNQFGDLERCSLRPGNVHSADGWREVLEPVVERYRERNLRRYFRGDAAFAAPDIYEFLESEGFLYAIRLPKNQILQESIAHLLTRPVGRPPNHVRRYYASFRYQAGSWDRKRRVVAKVEWHPGELCPRVGFIVTNLSRPAERVVAFYNHRGTAEQYIKEGKYAIKWTRLSCSKFRNNEACLSGYHPHPLYVVCTHFPE